MNARIHLGLIVATAMAGCLVAQDAADALKQRESELRQQLQSLNEQLTTARAAGLQGMKVNGQMLSPQQVRREAIFLVGAKIVEAKIADFFVEEWMERAIADGRDPEDFQVSEEDVNTDLRSRVAEFQEQNPGVEFWEAVRALTGLSREGYMQQTRQTELFNKVFFPGPAASWPNITKEAIIASASNDTGQQFWENIEKSSTDPETGEPRELPAFWMQLCRGWVQKQLKKWSDIRYPSDGLAPEVVLSVNGREWKTDEAFDMVRPALFLQDIERALMEVAVREALKQELSAKGAYLSDEEFRAEFDEFRKEYDDTPFTTEVIATAFKGYPSLEAYRQRWRLIRSFEKMIAADINDDNLAAHAEKFNRFFSDGQSSVDLIQFLARDVKTGAWQPDGFPKAKARAEAVWQEIENGGSFDDLLKEKGEFYANDESKGRLGYKSLNQLRQSLHENEFTDLLQGFSLGYHLFYDAEPGRIAGPMRGASGYYIARVNARTPARGTTSVEDARTRELVKQDFVTWRFLQWANEVVARAEIQ
ncbi:MAG: hypothetical protein AAF628_18905 [Planctomycetota bacterium]